MKRHLLLSALLLLLPLVALADDTDRPIVYGARYYAAPGSTETTHFHIYRINPDGTGRVALTAGNDDDTNPVWSADGSKIYFMRGDHTFCSVDPAGTRVAVIDQKKTGAWVADNVISDVTRDILWERSSHRSPDGTRRLDWTPGEAAVVRRMDDNRSVESYPDLADDSPTWLDNKTLIGYDQTNGALVLQTVGGRGRNVRLHRPDTPQSFMEGFLEGTWLYAPPRRVPTVGPCAIVFKDTSSSTVRPDGTFYRVDLATGLVTVTATDKQFLIVAPDGVRYCTAPGRATAPYDKRRNARERTVWVAPLQVGDLQTGAVTTISKGLVWVIGADWR